MQACTLTHTLSPLFFLFCVYDCLSAAGPSGMVDKEDEDEDDDDNAEKQA